MLLELEGTIFTRMENILFLLQMNEQKTKLLAELKFKTARAGGKGGQHVNKVSSKVMLIWPLAESACFNAEQKELLQSRLENRINKAGEFFLEASTDRSQLANKEIAIARFFNLLEDALKVDKPRKKTKIPKAKVLERLDRKKKQAQKKADRGNRFEI